ncbi:MAG: PEP/pyruvate-binding domain-containing protein [Chloroflexota bacterium]|nr:PEP/pyruvate-binding domain-containing protein [Chloroflexota bacterium]
MVDAVLACWRSVSSERAVAYRRERGIDGLARIAVLIQELADADVAAIAFSGHLERPRRRGAHLDEGRSALRGAPIAAVDGIRRPGTQPWHTPPHGDAPTAGASALRAAERLDLFRVAALALADRDASSPGARDGPKARARAAPCRALGEGLPARRTSAQRLDALARHRLPFVA